MSKYIDSAYFRNKKVSDMDKKELLKVVEWLGKEYDKHTKEYFDKSRKEVEAIERHVAYVFSDRNKTGRWY